MDKQPRNGADAPKQASCRARSQANALELTPEQQSVLCVMRCYFASYARPQSIGWEAGMDHAVKLFGEDKGPKVAWCCLRTVQAMRTSRRSMFHFCDPACPCCRHRLTPNEGHLMRSLQAVADGQMGQAKLASMMLCEGNPDGAFLDAIVRLEAELSAP